MRVLHILNDVTDQGNGIVNTAVDLATEQAARDATQDGAECPVAIACDFVTCQRSDASTAPCASTSPGCALHSTSSPMA